jgi:hypothetical protein
MNTVTAQTSDIVHRRCEALFQGDAFDIRVLRSVKGFIYVLYIFIIFFITIYYCVYKSHGLGQAKPEPSRVRRLWLGLEFEKAKAGSGQAKAGPEHH